MQDQLRDRRTLFMIVVLPVLLYPLLAMSFFQVSQFTREREMRVLLIGAPELAGLPPLVENGQFSSLLAPHHMLRVSQGEAETRTEASSSDALASVRGRMQEGNYDVVVAFPPDFAARLNAFRAMLLTSDRGESGLPIVSLPSIELYPNLAKDTSRIAYQLVAELLNRWRSQLGERNLTDRQIAPLAARPFELLTQDVAQAGQHEAVLWSKILPLVLVLWALTGAFCPAIDLCAGERERGTLETLLCGPAGRSEIVWGKLFTVTLVSMATALVNLAALAGTGAFVLAQFPDIGPPPWIDFVWLTVALVPLSTMFSAICLGLAAFARSTKEGQYYLMPLLLLAMPLSILPMAPHIELGIGTSLIPVTGIVLLLRTALEADYFHALIYSPLVAAMTFPCCWLAIRFAVRQFENESVLFRDAERWNGWLWLRALVRERREVPCASLAIGCGFSIVVLRFLLSFVMPAPQSLRDVEVLTVVTQLFVVAMPAMLLTLLFARSPRQTLALRLPRGELAFCAVALAVVAHPLVDLLQTVVMRIYPLDEHLAVELHRLFAGPVNLPVLMLVLCVLPAVCEEIAFRGFILSGLKSTGGTGMAIVVSSIFFAATHAVFQQSLIAGTVGLVIGLLVIESGSLLPGVLFHVVHNSIGIGLQQISATVGDNGYWLHWLLRDVADEGCIYRWPILLASLLASALLLARFRSVPVDGPARLRAPAF